MGQRVVTGWLMTSGQFCDCNCLPIRTDCKCNCIPQCLHVDISGWGSGYVYAVGDPFVGGNEIQWWQSFIPCDGCCPPVFWLVYVRCHCPGSGEEPCGDNGPCGWQVLVEGYYSGIPDGAQGHVQLLDPPPFSTGWQCADIQACSYPGAGFGSIEHHFAELQSGGTDVVVTLPPRDKDCCANDCCSEVLDELEEIHLTIMSAGGGSLTVTLTRDVDSWCMSGAIVYDMECEFGSDGNVYLSGACVRCIQGVWQLTVHFVGCEDLQQSVIFSACQTDWICDPFLVEFSGLAQSDPNHLEKIYMCCEDSLTFILTI